MPTIILATFGSFGDVFPYLALGQELRRRGHRAVLATSAMYRDTVERSGLAFAPVRPDVDFEDDQVFRRAMEPKRGTEFVVRELVIPALRETYRDLATACEGADLLVSHVLTYAAPILGEKTGLPWVSTVLSPMVFCSAHDPPALAPAPWIAGLRRFGPGPTGLLLRLLKKVSWSWSAPIRELRTELGLAADADPLWEGQHSPRGVLALFSRHFAQPQPDWPPHTTICGFPFHDADFGNGGDDGENGVGNDAARLDRFLGEGSAPLVFSLGSSAVQSAGDFYVAAAESARRLDRRAVLVVGGSPAPPTLPDEVLAIRSTAVRPLFEAASVVVHAGGVGSTAQALRAGLPQLVVPFAHDQFDNAVRAERLGVGRNLARSRLTSARLTRALEQLLAGEETRGRATELAAKIRSEHGTERACDALEQALTG